MSAHDVPPATPSTPASGGHDHVDDGAFVAGVHALRARDRALLRALPKIGLLALPIVILAIAVPNFLTFNCRARSSEAKSGLKTMFVAERTYFAQHDTFSTDMQAIGWSPGSERSRYSWYVHADAASFHAVAVGTADLSGDVWRIGTDGIVEQLADGCR